MVAISNKTVFITGASSGIGEACANVFAENGARLILCARRLERLEKLAANLKKQFNAEVYITELDVTKREKVNACIKHLPNEWQSIDILINNAGLAAGLNKVYESDVEDWEQMIDTNVKGVLYLTRALLPNMVARNVGHIINIGSIAGHEVYPNGAVYCATKFAINAISKGLKMDLLGTKVRVSSVDPGMVKTEFSKVRFKGDTDKADTAYLGMTPLRGEDVADAILYCSTRPAHVNISEIIVLANDQSAATLVHSE